MAEVLQPVAALPESDRVELEKFCQFLLTFYVRMLEKPKSDHLIKGSLMSTQKANGCSNDLCVGEEGSSVDAPNSPKGQIASLLQEVHKNIPELESQVEVPAQLPEDMTKQPFQITLQDIEKIYPPEQAEAVMEKNEALTRLQVFMLYMRGFRNCLECDPGSVLQSVQDEVAKHSLQLRIISYLAIILADVTEVCYPNRRLPVVMAELMSDLSEYRNRDLVTDAQD